VAAAVAAGLAVRPVNQDVPTQPVVRDDHSAGVSR
jgi:hypothetical protein